MISPRIIRDPIFVLVDAYRSGSFLASTFLSYGYRCVHVQSVEKPVGNSSNGGPYIEEILHRDLDTTVATLKKYQVKAVIPGHEVGVELADSLSDAIGTHYRNGTALSATRRDKFLMREHAASVGINCPRFGSFSEATAARQFAIDLGNVPLVVKPTRSAGGQGVRLCSNADAVFEQAKKILAGRSVSGEPNSSVIVEEYIPGDLFMVNTVSIAGKHYVTDLWATKKNITDSGAFIFDFTELVGANESTEVAVRFTLHLLEKFGIEFGPAHTEVLIHPDGRPFLVEVGARIQGNMDPSMTVPALGTNQIVATVQSYVGASRVLEGTGLVPELKSRCRAVDLIVGREGLLKEDLDIAPVRARPSFWSARIDVRRGSKVDPTSELLNVPGSIVLVHDDDEVLERDYEFIREWESSEYERKLQADPTAEA